MPEAPLPFAVREFLGQPHPAALATLGRDGAPQATAVWFLLEAEVLLVNTARGRSKARNLDRDPRVALAVFDAQEPSRSVQVRGRVQGRREGAAAAADLQRLSRHYTGHDFPAAEDRISYLITPESWSSYGLIEGD